MRSAVALVVVLALALALPVAAMAQSATLLDDTQRAAIQEFYDKQVQQAAEAEQARKAAQQKKTEKTKNGAKKPVKAPAKKKVEKPKQPKKPIAPKASDKGKGKDKSKANGKAADGAKPAAQAAQRNLDRGEVLPPDLPRRALPKALDSQLGKPARGTQRVIVGDDVMLIERKTGKILDVMAGVAKNLGPGR